MRGQIERLTKLSTDLLDLSRLDADALGLRSEAIDVGELVAEVAAEFAAAAEQHDSGIEVDAGGAGEPLAQADRARTAQILRILIDNALKHTAPGTEIAITSSSTPTETRLTVSDDGPGIDPRSSANGSSSASTPPTRSAAPASASRSLASWPARWAATSSSTRAGGRGTSISLTLPARGQRSAQR